MCVVSWFVVELGGVEVLANVSETSCTTVASLFFFFQAEDGIRDLGGRRIIRSEEHTSELQSRSDLVCRLLLEKKKKVARTLITLYYERRRSTSPSHKNILTDVSSS